MLVTCRSRRSPFVLMAIVPVKGEGEMNPQYVELASLVMVWGGVWLRDTGSRALFPLRSWLDRLTP
jgi:hypothetical protein